MTRAVVAGSVLVAAVAVGLIVGAAGIVLLLARVGRSSRTETAATDPEQDLGDYGLPPVEYRIGRASSRTH